MKNAPAPGAHPGPADRRRMLDIVAGSSLPTADDWLVQGLGDPAEAVWSRAGEALAYRHPWLMLAAAQTGPLSPAAQRRHRFGAAWFRLRGALAQFARELPAGAAPPPERFALVPGLLPDWMQALSAAGRPDDAACVARLLAEDRPPGGAPRQILLAPTYSCNLDCAYCYAKDWAREFPGHMSLEDFRAALRWCRGQGLDWILLCGGEPTAHRAFGELVEEAGRQGMRISLASNGLFGEAARASLRPAVVAEFICHVEQEVLLGDPRRTELLLQNIAAARAAGVEVRIRYTLTSRSDRAERLAILGLARDQGIRMVNYGFAFRNIDGNNDYFAHDRGRPVSFDAVLNSFMDEARDAGLALHLAKPFPLCHVTPRTLKRVALEGGLRTTCTAWRLGYSMNLTINPDLTTLPCSALRRPGPRITDFPDLRAASRFHENTLRPLFASPWQPKCARCVLHHRGICQGVCLAERCSTLPPAGG